jgi:CRP-like cAMP-binding protein
MFFLQSGSVQVVRNNRIIENITGHTFFGEVGIVDKRPRTASIRAVDFCELFVLTYADMQVRRKAYSTLIVP